MAFERLILVASLVLGVITVVSVGAADEAGRRFVETFEGAPSSPTSWSSDHWDVIVHHRSDGATNSMAADHDAMCGAPPATHHIISPSEAVFLCRDHLMTAVNSDDSGYAVVYLSPAALADWSRERSTIAFDVSTARSTNRDWIDVWLTPWDANMVLPFEGSAPDLNGEPRTALHFRLVNTFAWDILQSPGNRKLAGPSWPDLPVPYSAKQRDTFTITIGDGVIAMRYLNVATGVSRPIAQVPLPKDLGFDRAVVQFGHHSYTPSKDCPASVIQRCGPNTWHWDNVRIEPALPFSMKHLGGLTKPGAIAVSPGWLRFAARGPTEVNWGAGWVPIEPVNGPAANNGQFASYFVPVPGRATQVQMRGSPTWMGPWRAENIAIWSLPGPDPSTLKASPPVRHTGPH